MINLGLNGNPQSSEDNMTLAKKLKKQQLTTRFAPSPTGHLHLGHVISAVTVWEIARAYGAKIILRIEDHDRQRSRKEFESSILKDLDWLGFQPDDGVSNVDSPSPFRQSDCGDFYENILNLLLSHKLAYACACTRSNLANFERYPGTCRYRGLDPTKTSSGIRFCVDDKEFEFNDLLLGNQSQNPDQQCGDFLLRDRHHNFTYQFCVVIDDLRQGVNLIIRGQDLTDSTARQMNLASPICKLTERKLPTWKYLHHPVLLDENGIKLSKRLRSTTIKDLRDDGWTAQKVLESVRNHLYFLEPLLLKKPNE